MAHLAFNEEVVPVAKIGIDLMRHCARWRRMQYMNEVHRRDMRAVRKDLNTIKTLMPSDPCDTYYDELATPRRRT